MYAKIIIDNISKSELQPEWGLSVYIEQEGKKILLDTGAGGKFAENAAALGIALEEIDYAVLSHAHYDHANGMGQFFEKNVKASFHLRKGAAENCYAKKWVFHKYIGVKKGLLAKYRSRIVYADGTYELFLGAYLLAHSTPGLGELGKKAGMYVRCGCRLQPDDFSHEQSLVLDTPKGLVIFNSCSHGGADNIIAETAAAFPQKHIYALIGGLHLFASPEAEVRALAERIRSTGIERVITGHCTGKRAYAILHEELGGAAEQMYAGMEILV